MAPPPSLLRGGGIPPSTVSYVLSLVRRSYLPQTRHLYLASSLPVAAASRYTKRRDTSSQIFNRSHLSSSSSSSFPSSRHASSAHAVLQYDHLPEYSPSSTTTIDASGLAPLNHPLQRTLPSLPLRRPRALRSFRHLPSAAASRAAFESSNCTPLHFADPSFLADVTLLFLRSSEPSTWAWLSGQLGHLISDLSSPDVPPIWRELREAAKALRSYALTELDQWEYARRELVGTSNIMDGSLGFKHGLRALVFGRMGDWDAAREEVSRSIARWTPTETKTPKAYSPLDMEVLGRYIDLFGGQDRGEEVFILLGNKRLQDRIRRRVNTELVNLIYAALADLPDPGGSLVRFLQNRTLAQGRMVASTMINALLRLRIDDAVEVIRQCLGAGISFSPSEMGYFTAQLHRAGRLDDLQAITNALPEENHTRFALLQRLHRASERRRREELESAWTDLKIHHSASPGEILAYANGLASLGLADQVRATLSSVFGDSIERKVAPLTLLHIAYSEAHDIDASCQYLDKLIAIRPKISDFNRTLAVLASHADVPFTVELFDSISSHGIKPDRASFTTLISLFANRRDQENAQTVFDAMQDAGFEPDAVAHAALLNAYVEAGDWEGAATRFDAMSPDIKANASVATTVLKALVLLASPTDRIMRTFRGMRAPSKYVWALAIQSAADNGDLGLTRDLYEEMEAASLAPPDAPKPGVHIHSILLHAYLRAGYSESAKEVYDEMLRQHIVPTSVTYGMVVASFSRLSEARSMIQAQEFAEEIYKQSKRERALEAARSRGTVEENIFGPLLSASAKEGNIDSAVEYFSLASATTESIPTYSKLMDAYRRAGNVDSVLEIWKKVLAYAIQETSHRISSAASFARTQRNENMLCIPLSIALDALSSAGRYFDVKKVWADTEAAGFGFDSQNYNHYAIALARTGDIESAFAVVDRVIMPKWEEIRTRRVAALREHAANRASNKAAASAVSFEGDLASVTVSTNVDEGADAASNTLIPPREPVPPAFRPPNRRDEHRWGDGDPSGGSTSSSGTLAMLQKWRPSDALWRPSKLTISVLEHAYRQLEESKRRAMWMALPADREEDADVEGAGGEGSAEQITFPSFNHVPLRGPDGEPHKGSVGLMLVRLNRKYLRVVGLIMLHRKKQRARDAIQRRSR